MTAPARRDLVRSLVAGGDVSGIHDVGDGGLGVCLAELALHSQVGVPTWVSGVVVAVLTWLVVIGGVKSIGRAAEKLAREGYKFIIGPIGSASVMAMKPITERNKVIMLSNSYKMSSAHDARAAAADPEAPSAGARRRGRSARPRHPPDQGHALRR